MTATTRSTGATGDDFLIGGAGDDVLDGGERGSTGRVTEISTGAVYANLAL